MSERSLFILGMQPESIRAIDVRLRRQHARWLLSQPDFPSPWLAMYRKCGRPIRRVVGLLTRWYVVHFALVVAFFLFFAWVTWLLVFSMRHQTAPPTPTSDSIEFGEVAFLALAIVNVCSAVGWLIQRVGVTSAEKPSRPKRLFGRNRQWIHRWLFVGSVLSIGLLLLGCFDSLTAFIAAQLMLPFVVWVMYEFWYVMGIEHRSKAERPSWLDSSADNQGSITFYLNRLWFKPLFDWLVTSLVFIGSTSFSFYCVVQVCGGKYLFVVPLCLLLVGLFVLIARRKRIQRTFRFRYKLMQRYRLRPLASLAELKQFSRPNSCVGDIRVESDLNPLPIGSLVTETSSTEAIAERVDGAVKQRDSVRDQFEVELHCIKSSWRHLRQIFSWRTYFSNSSTSGLVNVVFILCFLGGLTLLMTIAGSGIHQGVKGTSTVDENGVLLIRQCVLLQWAVGLALIEGLAIYLRLKRQHIHLDYRPVSWFQLWLGEQRAALGAWMPAAIVLVPIIALYIVRVEWHPIIGWFLGVIPLWWISVRTVVFCWYQFHQLFTYETSVTTMLWHPGISNLAIAFTAMLLIGQASNAGVSQTICLLGATAAAILAATCCFVSMFWLRQRLEQGSILDKRHKGSKPPLGQPERPSIVR
ncbi:MAG: hypothetical protein AAFN77_07340 [Planctomycetota bacterium]